MCVCVFVTLCVCVCAERNRERREQGMRKELELAREENSDLRSRVEATKENGRDQCHKAVAHIVRVAAAAKTLEGAGRAAATAAGLIVVRPIKNGHRYRPEVLEGARRLTTVAHTSLHHVATVVDTAFVMLTGIAPTAEFQLHKNVGSVAHQRLGLIDKRRLADLLSKSKGWWVMNSDTGNKGNCPREVIIIGIWEFESDKPKVHALSCSEIFQDQSGRNGADVLLQVIKEYKLNPHLCAAFGGDSTGHAVEQRFRTAEMLAKGEAAPAAAAGAQPRRTAAQLRAIGCKHEIILHGCVRHFKELEIHAFKDGVKWCVHPHSMLFA